MNLKEIDIERITEQMIQKKEYLKTLRISYDKNNEEKRKLFTKYINKLKPVFDILKEERYYFKNPDVTLYMSSKGPVLAHDSKKNDLYVYNLEKDSIIKTNLYDNKEEYVPLWQFIENNNYDNAIKGLVYTLELQNDVIKECKDSIDRQEKELQKYKID